MPRQLSIVMKWVKEKRKEVNAMKWEMIQMKGCEIAKQTGNASVTAR